MRNVFVFLTAIVFHPIVISEKWHPCLQAGGMSLLLQLAFKLPALFSEEKLSDKLGMRMSAVAGWEMGRGAFTAVR